MNDEGMEMVLQTASNLSFNAWMRKQNSGTTQKTKSTVVADPYPCLDFSTIIEF